MFDEHMQDYLDTIAWLQRLPALEMQSTGGNGEPPMPEAVADLIRDWRRMRHQDLPAAMCEALARCDENTLFNIVNRCLDILLRQIVPKYDRRRQRRRERNERRRARALAQTADALAGAFGGAEGATAAAGAAESDGAPART
jgi:hypothetical protein